MSPPPGPPPGSPPGPPAPGPPSGGWEPLPPNRLDRWCYPRRQELYAVLGLAALVVTGVAVWVISTGRAGWVLLPVAVLLVVQIGQLHLRLKRVGVRIQGEQRRRSG